MAGDPQISMRSRAKNNGLSVRGEPRLTSMAARFRLEPEQTKTSEGRIIPLSSELVDTLRQIEPKEGTVLLSRQAIQQ